MNEFALRVAAVTGAVALVAGPEIVAFLKSLPKRLPSRPSVESDGLGDAHTILEIAQRLAALGSVKGVELCQQLIDEILSGQVKK